MTGNEKLKDLCWRVEELQRRIDELLKLEDKCPFDCPQCAVIGDQLEIERMAGKQTVG